MNESQQSSIECKVYPTLQSEGNHRNFTFSTLRHRPLLDHIEIEIEGECKIEKKDDLQKQELNLNLKEIDTIEDFYGAFIARTDQECKDELLHLQKSEGWLKSRHYCITASQFGTALGLNPYQNPDDFIQEKLYHKFEGNASTEWGNEHENDARKIFYSWIQSHFISLGYSQIEFLEPNLIKYSTCPWIGVSPDGIVKYVNSENKECWDLIEYKCPSKYEKDKNPYDKYVLGVPPQYMAQIQGIMGYCNNFSQEYKFTKAWFIVWTPHNTFIKEVMYKEDYFNCMYKELQEWYFKKYLPNVFLQFKNIKTQIIL